jgi:TPR repeat protein
LVALAVAFADRACTGGVLAGCVLIGMAKLTGDGVAKDVKGGLGQLDALCTQGEPTACESLAKLYTTGLGTDVAADPLRVRDYRKRACDLGLKRSCDADKLLATVDSAENTGARANALFQKSCDMGNLTACGLLGENLVGGIGASVDRDRGTALLDKACKGGVDRACAKLAEAGHAEKGSTAYGERHSTPATTLVHALFLGRLATFGAPGSSRRRFEDVDPDAVAASLSRAGFPVARGSQTTIAGRPVKLVRATR